jgi:hypothetical protein
VFGTRLEPFAYHINDARPGQEFGAFQWLQISKHCFV